MKSIKPVVHERIESLEAGRGIAALAVVLLHSGTGMVPAQYSGHVGLNDAFNFGKFGVDFFFVLSGYIMNRISISKGSGLGESLRFLIRRLFRILPTYWVVLFISVLINRFQRGRVELNSEWVISQIFLLDSPLFVSAAWTLQFEFLFYFLMAIAIFSRAVGLLLFVVWCALLVYRGAFLNLGIAHDDFFQVISNPYCVLFFFGYIGCEIVEHTNRGVFYSALIFLICFALYFLADSASALDGELLWRVLLGAGFVLTIAVARRYEYFIKGRATVFVLLGKISYSLYISHVLVLGLSYWALTKIRVYHLLPELCVILIAISICVLFAMFLYRFVEKPFIRIGVEAEKRYSRKIG